MTQPPDYFFCGIGGSGMMPLSLVAQEMGATVEGSDRSNDQGRNAEKFGYLAARGIRLHPQDGSGLLRPTQVLVTSAAVEETIPDVAAARRVGARAMTRAELLAQLFNAAPFAVGVAGTSGKSTTTGMIGWILADTGRDPTIVNGADMKNFVTPDAPFASARVGRGEAFVSEVDESDGSIALYRPRVAVINNIALDHKTMDELRTLFRGFAERAWIVVLNLDNPETAALAAQLDPAKMMTYAVAGGADLVASRLQPRPAGMDFVVTLRISGATAAVSLQVPGRHNVANALAALAAALSFGVPLGEAAASLGRFTGIRRRLDVVGEAMGVTVIDDFGHNPDKIAATLDTLHDFPGRLLVMFQPQGYGPLRLMKDAFIACLAEKLNPDDVLVMPAPAYFGGTADKSVGSGDITAGIAAQGRTATAYPDRAACAEQLVALARAGDRIVVMGARDDTLTQYAFGLLESLRQRSSEEPPSPSS